MLSTSLAFEPVSVPRLYRVIANQIKAKIEAQEFKPGVRLPSERDLADVLQVSRPTLREALIALEIEGYVEVRVGSGVFVAAPKEEGIWRSDESTARATPHAQSENDIGPFELMEARLLLEPQIAALAALNASSDQVQTIRAAAQHQPGSSGHSSGYNKDDRAFHLAIAQASGNAALSALVSHLLTLRDSSELFTRLDRHIVDEPVWKQADHEHLNIVDAITARKPDLARAAMCAHLSQITERLRKDLQVE